ncbi:MAG: SDR family NAD(P)-dependent oxidoreductase, partial [Oscillospiraceae bacterium]
MGKKVAIITGGSRGIGAAITKRFAKDGFDVVFNYNRAKEAGMAVAKECESFGAKTLLLQ